MRQEANSLEFSSLHDEFVLVGPLGKRDQILARSEDTGMDLIGYAMDKGDAEEVHPLDRLFRRQIRSLHRVSSWPVNNPRPEEDDRKTTFRFAWVGLCSQSDLQKIEKSFNANIYDIAEAVSENDKSQLELALAPILLRCSRANERVLSRRRQKGFLIGAYVGLSIAMAIGFAVQQYMETLP